MAGRGHDGDGLRFPGRWDGRAAARQDERLVSFAERLNAAPTASDKWQLLNQEIQNLGFSGATYGLSSGLRHGGINREVIYYSSYRQDFFATYKAEGFADDDYAVLHCAKSDKPALWRDIKQVYKTARSEQFQELANDCGLREGIVIPFRAPNDMKISGTGLSFAPGSEGDSQRLLSEHWRHILDLCTAFDEAMRRPTALQQTYRLSDRELECLTLTCLGFLGKEIAAKLALKEKSVEYYLATAVRKLKARNKHNAAAKAAVLGLIIP